MPINAFGGGPGTGKTYGVVEHVILPAIAEGRFVLTNIDGLNVDAIYDYVVEKYGKLDKIICVGHIRSCGRGRPGDDDFFPGESSLDNPCAVPDLVTDRVVGGDLVVIDEATRYWPMGEKASKAAQFFFREHRHFSNELGQTCDLVVIDPDLMLLNRHLRGKIELSSITHKPKGLGLNKYTVRMYRQCKLTGKPQSIGGPYAFKPEVYALYRSYSHEGAKETAIDGRQNILRSKFLWSYVAFLVLVLSAAGYFLWGYFHPSAPVVADSGVVPAVLTHVPGQMHSPSAISAPGAATPRISEQWRLVGSYSGPGGAWVVLADPDGRIRMESPSVFTGGLVAVGQVDGATVTRYSGRDPRSMPAKEVLK